MERCISFNNRVSFIDAAAPHAAPERVGSDAHDFGAVHRPGALAACRICPPVALGARAHQKARDKGVDRRAALATMERRGARHFDREWPRAMGRAVRRAAASIPC